MPGEYGRSEGTWTESDTDIVLTPVREEGMMRGHLRRLEKLEPNGERRLVPPEDIYNAKRYSDEPFSAFYAFKRMVEESSTSNKTTEPTR